MITIPLANSILDIIQPVFFMIFIGWKWNDIKTIFCEGSTGAMSSKRVIAIMGMYTLCKLAILVTHPDKPIDPYILLTFSVITLLAAAIATMPQLLDGFSKIKTVIPGALPGATIKSSTREEKVEIQNKPAEQQQTEQEIT